MSLRITTFLLIILAVYAATGAHAGDSAPTTPVPAKTNSEQWWNGQFERILNDIKKLDGNVDLAFIGDSITARWGNGELFKKSWGMYRAVNMGIGGDQTQHVLWRNENGQLDGYKAKVFVILIGTNNCWGKTTDTEAVAAGVKAIIGQIQTKQPQAKILLLSILPCGNGPKSMAGRETRAAVTDLIAKFAGGAVHYMDIRDKFLEPDKSISVDVMKDALHLTEKGYDIWAAAISDKVKELMGEASSGKTP